MMAVFTRLRFPRKPRISPFEGFLAAGVMLALVAIWSLFAGLAYETCNEEWNKASIFCNDVTALLEQDVERNIELYDLSIKAASFDLNDAEVSNLPISLQRKVLFGRAANIFGIGSILVLDKHGGVILDSKGTADPTVNFADRPYFIAQRDGTDTSQPLITHPFKSRISSLVGIGVSRRRTAPDGSFDGVVIGMMTLDYFASLFNVVHLPPDNTIALLHRDGTVMMREPEVEGAIGRNVRPDPMFALIERQPTGSFVKRSVFDNVQRLIAYKQVGDLPIYMTVGLSTDDFLRRWRWRTQLMGLGFLVLSIIIVFLGFLLAHELDRRAEAERTLANLAATDGLTQLANRRRFDEALDTEWRRAARESTPLSLLMIDGDFFKAFNDTYGHVVGDEALRTIANVLRHCVSRAGDLVARFGGEEFVVLLPQTDVEGAMNVARSIRQALVAVDVPHLGSPFGTLTISVGVASRRPKGGNAAADLVQAADAALYAAKAEGRDRIVSCQCQASKVA